MTTALSIQDLRKVYGNGFEALKGISLEVQQGDFFALLGPNGAGKSTTLGIVSSLVNKSSGKVSVFGHDIDTHLAQAKQCLGVVPQEFNFNPFEKVIDIVVTQAGYYGIGRKQATERAERYLRQLGLWDKRNERARMLSGGMKRRLMIARALIHEPKLLILDEPTAGVDIELRRSMWDFLTEINAAGTTIILTTHYLEEAQNLCNRIAMMKQGRLVALDSTEHLLRAEQGVRVALQLSAPLPAALQPWLTGEQDGNLLLKLDDYNRLGEVLATLKSAGIEVLHMALPETDLEDVFVKLTR